MKVLKKPKSKDLQMAVMILGECFEDLTEKKLYKALKKFETETEEEEVLTPQEAAKRLKVTDKCILQKIWSGIIYAKNLFPEASKAVWRIPKSEIDRLLKKEEAEAVPAAPAGIKNNAK